MFVYMYTHVTTMDPEDSVYDLTLLGTIESGLESHQRRAPLPNEGGRGAQPGKTLAGKTPSPCVIGTRVPFLRPRAVGDRT